LEQVTLKKSKQKREPKMKHSLTVAMATYGCGKYVANRMERV